VSLALLLAAFVAVADPAAFSAQLAAGQQAIAAGRYADAAGVIQQALATRPRSARAWLLLARAQSGQQQAGAALESLKKALQVAPNAEDVLVAYAQVALAVQAPVPAILALDPLARMSPGNGQYHYLLGVALLQAGDVPAATEALERARLIDPDRVVALVALGLSLNNRKLYDQALPHLRRAQELEPDNVEVIANLAEAEEGRDDLDAAEAHAARVLASAPGHPTANFVMGMVLMKRERFAEARDRLEKALAAGASPSKTHYQLSLACARLGDMPASESHRQQYQAARGEIEARLVELRNKTGIGEGMAR
jgi:tetratricopeptide (TPR) repeat protein